MDICNSFVFVTLITSLKKQRKAKVFHKTRTIYCTLRLQVTCGVLIQPSLSIVVEALGEDLYEVSVSFAYRTFVWSLCTLYIVKSVFFRGPP